MNIDLGGQFASWAGTLLSLGAPIVIIAEDHEQVDEAVMRLARVGIETVSGYLDSGMYAWDQADLPTVAIAQMPVDELKHQLAEHADLQIIDVRRPAEFATGHVPGAINAQLAHLEEALSQFDSQRPTAVLCAGGYRSTAATSVLAQHGFTRLFNVIGGTSAWINAGYPVEGVETSAR